MSCTLQVVVGPNRSGKTRQLIERYADHITRKMAAGAFGAGLWLAPNRYAVDHVTRLLLKGLPAGCLAPQVHTFEGFSEQVLRLAPVPVRPLSRHQVRYLLRQVVQQLAGEGQLPYLKPLADSRGLFDTLAAQISEWKRLEIWPEDFETACGRSTPNPKDADLARIYRSYQQVLQSHQLYDAEGRFWSARTLLREGHRQPIESVELVVVDGFTDFMPPQHEMLHVLTEIADEMWISLPMDEPPRSDTRQSPREDLFSKPLATLDELKRRHDRLTIKPATATVPSGGAKGVFGKLFRPPADADDASAREGQVEPPRLGLADAASRPIAVWETTSPLQEIRGIVRDIKACWRAEAVRLEDVVVVYRSLRGVVPLFEEAFAEYGVPVYIESRRPLEAVPFIRNLLLLLQLDHSDWRYDDLLAFIRNRRIRWPALAGIDDERAVRNAAERLVRGLQIPSGREVFRRQLDRLAGGSRNEKTTAEAAEVVRGLSRLGGFLDQLPREATPAEWAAEVPRLYQLCGGAGAKAEEAASAAGDAAEIAADVMDQRARTRLIEALHQVQRLEQQIHGRPRTIPRSEALELLTDIACHEHLPQPAEMTGRVRVLSAISARGACADYVYFAGLDEHAMPLDTTSQAYYCEREIGRLIRAGLPLVSASRRYEEEMLLFYEVASLARRRLVLSYAALDAKAQPMLPSPFITEVQRVGGEAVAGHRQLELRPVDRTGPPLCPREYRTRAICDAVVDGSDADRLQRLAAGGESGEQARAVVAGLRIVAARAERDTFGPAEGIFTSEAALRSVAEKFGPEHPWSPTALERYAHCPFRFLLEKVLQIEPMDDLELTTDYRRRGSLAHQCLLELYRQVAELDGTTTGAEQPPVEFFRDHVWSFVQSAGERLTGGGFGQALEALDLEHVAELAEVLHEQQKCYEFWGGGLDTPLRPAHFEVRFGPPRDGAEKADEDPLSNDLPFVLDLGDEKIRLTGRVDRIDVGEVGGRKVFNIIDYKTGTPKPFKPDDIKSGLQLQIPLYAMAAEELLFSDDGGVAWQADYWWLREHGFGNKRQSARSKPPFSLRTIQDGELVESDQWLELKARLVERIRQIIRDVRDGKFAVYSQDPDCTRNCPYDGTCRIAHVRSLEKEWGTEGPQV